MLRHRPRAGVGARLPAFRLHLAKGLARARRALHLLRPDLPGMGETEWTDATDFSFPGQGRTLKAFVDRLGSSATTCLWR